VGFVGTAYATFILLLAYYLLGLHLQDSTYDNPIDAGIIKWIWRGHSPELDEKWTDAVQKVCHILIIIANSNSSRKLISLLGHSYA
jgi:hypothetical protein